MSEHSPTYQPPPDGGLDIRYIDDDLLVVDKPAGLLSVPGRGPGKQDCLSARVQARYPEALPVHRLDLGTSGLLVLARSADMHRALNRLFETRRVEKRYVALVAGPMDAGERVIDLPLIRSWMETAGYRGAHEVEIFSANHWWKRDPDEVLATCKARHAAVC